MLWKYSCHIEGDWDYRRMGSLRQRSRWALLCTSWAKKWLLCCYFRLENAGYGRNWNSQTDPETDRERDYHYCTDILWIQRDRRRSKGCRRRCFYCKTAVPFPIDGYIAAVYFWQKRKNSKKLSGWAVWSRLHRKKNSAGRG